MPIYQRYDLTVDLSLNPQFPIPGGLDIQVRMYLVVVKPTNNLQKMYITNLNKSITSTLYFATISL